MEKIIKLLKKVLFLTFLCFSILLLVQPKASAETVNITTVQELQEAMGATAYSTIEGTTLKITDNFTWTITDDVDIKIPELIIDFNGKELKIENISIFSTIKIEDKVIFKDSQGENGGIYCNTIIAVNEGAELIIENGTYIAARETVNVGTR